MAEDAVVIQVRTQGGPQAAAQMEAVSRAVRNIGGTTTVAGRGMRNLGTAATVAGKGLSNLRASMNLGATASYAFRRSVYVGGLAIGGLGALAVKTGIQFDAFQEQSRVAFTNLISSASGAQRELVYLQKTAAATPFELTGITDADRQLLAYNFTLKQTHSWLQTIGDTMAGSGGGPEKIQQMVLAIGQIRAKGFLQGQELLQLENLGVLDPNKLAKGLGLTVAQLHSGNAQIPAAKALAQIQKQLNATFGGQAVKQAGTFNGQLSTLHDNLQQTLGTITKPGFEYLRLKVLPDLGKATGAINTIFGRNDLSMSQKIGLSKAELDRDLGPLADAIGAQIKRANLPAKIGDEFGKAIPYIARKFADAGPKAAGAFISAWVHSGPWGMFLSASWLAAKMGAFGGIASVVAKKLFGGKGGGVLGQLTARGSTPANPLYVVDIGGGGVPGLPGGAKKAEEKAGKSLLGKIGGAIIGAGAAVARSPVKAAGIAGAAGAAVAGTESVITGHVPGWVPFIGGKDLTDPIIGGHKPRKALTTSRRTGGMVNQPLVISIDGKTVAQTMAQYAADAHTRRGGR